MTVWQNSRINSTPNIAIRAHDKYKKTLVIFYKIKTWVKKIISLKPHEFIKVHINQNVISFFHIRNKCVETKCEIENSYISIKELDAFLKPRSTLPLQIFIDDEDTNYKIISLSQTKWWNRYSIFNQIRISEFNTHDWIYNQNVPSPDDAHRYVFIGFKPSHKILEALVHLSNSTNPIAKIQLTSIQETAAAINWVKKCEPLQNIYPWSLFIRKISDTEWLLSAQQYSGIVLTRRGKFSENDSDKKVIENELAITLRYLQRNGYAENENITLLTAGFSDEFVADTFELINVANVIKIPTTTIEDYIRLKPYFTEFLNRDFWILNIIRHALKTPPLLYSKSFAPRPMMSQRIAYWIPFICRQLIIPISLTCLLALCMYTLKNSRLQNDLNTILSTKETLLTKIGDEKHRLLASNFDVFKNLIGKNPLPFLKKLSASLTREAHITQFIWNATKNNNHWHYAFEAKVTMLDQLNPLKQKMESTKTTYSKQQKIQKKLEKYYPNATVVWSPTPGKKIHTLGVSWD